MKTTFKTLYKERYNLNKRRLLLENILKKKEDIVGKENILKEIEQIKKDIEKIDSIEINYK